MLSISEFQFCQNENGSKSENIQCYLLITINNDTALQIVDGDSFNIKSVFNFLTI